MREGRQRERKREAVDDEKERGGRRSTTRKREAVDEVSEKERERCAVDQKN